MKTSILAGTLALALAASVSSAQAQSSEHGRKKHHHHAQATQQNLNTNNGYGDYSATASPDAYGDFGSAGTRAGTSPQATPDSQQIDPVPQYFDHAMGTMGTRGGK